MNNTSPLGLFRFLSITEQQEVEREISTSLADLFDLIDELRIETREFETLLDRLFYGARHGTTIE